MMDNGGGELKVICDVWGVHRSSGFVEQDGLPENGVRGCRLIGGLEDSFMAEPFDVVFLGNSRSECIDFIRAVRLYAKNNGKIRDNQWIADELYAAFDGEALGWYVTQPVNARADRELLQQALAARWITDVNDSVPSTPSPAAVQPAAPAAFAPFLPNLMPGGFHPWINWAGKVGRVQLRVDGLSEARYLSNRGETSNHKRLGCFEATPDASLALKVRLFMVAPNLCRLELVEHESKLSVLAAFSYTTADWTNMTWGLLVGVDGPGKGSLKDRQTSYYGSDDLKSGEFWTDAWQIDGARALKLCGPEGTTEIVRFALGVTPRNRNRLYMIGSKISLGSPHTEVHLEFEPSAN